MSMIDAQVKKEMASFEEISNRLLADRGNKYYMYQGSDRFNLRVFWAEHKTLLPIHYRVYMAEVGPNRAASANVETVFSGAGRFSKEAEKASADLLRRIVRLHYAWKYPFLRPPVAEVVNRYNAKHHPALHAMLSRKAEAALASTGELPSSAEAVATEELRERSSLAREMIEGEDAVAAVADLDSN